MKKHIYWLSVLHLCLPLWLPSLMFVCVLSGPPPSNLCHTLAHTCANIHDGFSVCWHRYTFVVLVLFPCNGGRLLCWTQEEAVTGEGFCSYSWQHNYQTSDILCRFIHGRLRQLHGYQKNIERGGNRPPEVCISIKYCKTRYRLSQTLTSFTFSLRATKYSPETLSESFAPSLSVQFLSSFPKTMY